MFNFLLYC